MCVQQLSVEELGHQSPGVCRILNFIARLEARARDLIFLKLVLRIPLFLFCVQVKHDGPMLLFILGVFAAHVINLNVLCLFLKLF